MPSSWQNTFLMGKEPANLSAQAVQGQGGDLATPEGSLPPLEARTSQGSTTSFSYSTSAPLITPRRSEPPPIPPRAQPAPP